MNPRVLTGEIDWQHVYECCRESRALHRPIRRRVPRYLRRKAWKQRQREWATFTNELTSEINRQIVRTLAESLLDTR